MIEKPFIEIINNDTELGLYVELVAYCLQKDDLTSEEIKQIETILYKYKEIELVVKRIKLKREELNIYDVPTFLYVDSFSDDLILPIRNAILRTLSDPEWTLSDYVKGKSKKIKDEIES